MESDFEKRLWEILKDNKSGSSEIEEKLIKLFIEILSKENLTDKLIGTAKTQLREFAAIENLLTKLSKFPAPSEQLNFLRRLLTEKNSVIPQLYEKLKSSLHRNSKITTISNSKTLLEIFLLAFSDFPEIEIFVTESRPVNEGVIMAERLADKGLNVTLITEAMLPEFVSKSNFALIGADKILPDGSVINKIGSRLIAILCDYFGKPFFTIADNSKLVSSNSIELTQYPKSEIYSGPNSLLKVGKNYYFEKIEKKLISKIISN